MTGTQIPPTKPPAGARVVSARGRSRIGRQTKERIIAAALETVRTQGLVGASARAIARTGQFNQALLFYHFGSIEELLLASLRWANQQRLDHFGERLEGAASLVDLVDIADDLYSSDQHDHQSALVAIVAGWPADSKAGKQVMAILRPWDEMVQAALRRCLRGSELVRIMPTEDLAFGLVSLLLGVELNRRFAGNEERTRSLLAGLHSAAAALS